MHTFEDFTPERWNQRTLPQDSATALHALAQEIGRVAIAALNASFDRFTALGEEGLANIQKNQHGETALRMDLEAEAEVIRVLREAKLPVRIFSEEHGIVDLSDDPRFTATLDGIDGTKEYKDNRLNGRYGTLLSVYLGDSPRYKDYLFAGMMVHAEKRLYSVSAGSAPTIQSPDALSDSGKSLPISLSTASTLTEGRVFVDEYFAVNREVFSAPLAQYRPQSTMSSTRYYAALLAGTADIVGECTRKGNLEIAAAYPLVTAAGGSFTTLDGVSLAEREFLKFGQGKAEYIPVIAAANISLLRHALDTISKP